MNIDQHKKEDGYYDENDVYYETAEDFYQSKIFGFCGCGLPEENLIFIRDGLEYIEKGMSGIPYEEWSDEGENLFGNESAKYFFFYWADKEELTEHGGSVPGWLTEKGKEYLEDLQEMYK